LILHSGYKSNVKISIFAVCPKTYPMNSLRKKHAAPDASRLWSGSVWFVAGLAAAGFVLQLLGGGFETGVLARPVNIFAGGAIVLCCAAAGLMADSRWVRRLTGVPLAVCLISGLAILGLIMGLTPQGAAPAGGLSTVSARLGFNDMTSSWPFVFLYLALLVALGSLVARRLAAFRWRDTGFYLNHLGLWLTLFGAGFGAADIERYQARVDEGTTVHMGFDTATGHPRPLPFKITLHDFVMEEYPAETPGGKAAPSRFASDVTLTSPGGLSLRGFTEVNHPLRLAGWRVYQYGYDRAAGTASTFSVVELGRDPWLGVVYTGFAMMAAGAVIMIWKGRRRHGLE
jgi:hypothetical protein